MIRWEGMISDDKCIFGGGDDGWSGGTVTSWSGPRNVVMASIRNCVCCGMVVGELFDNEVADDDDDGSTSIIKVL